MSLSGRIRTSLVTTLLSGAGALLAAGCGLLSTASPAVASSNTQSIFEVPSIEQPGVNPAGTLQELRFLGVNVIRVGATWEQFAPGSASQAGNPSAYNFGWLDTLVNDARADGIAVDMLISGGAPSWAVSPGHPRVRTRRSARSASTLCSSPRRACTAST